LSNGDWLTAFLAALSPTSAIVAVIVTNHYAEKRFQKELRSRIYEPQVSERRKSLLAIYEMMTRCQFDVIDVKRRGFVSDASPEDVKKLAEEEDAFRDEIVKCPWLDEKLREALGDVLDSFRKLTESGYTQERFKATGAEGLGVNCEKARAALKEALGIPAVEDYIRTLQRG